MLHFFILHTHRFPPWLCFGAPRYTTQNRTLSTSWTNHPTVSHLTPNKHVATSVKPRQSAHILFSWASAFSDIKVNTQFHFSNEALLTAHQSHIDFWQENNYLTDIVLCYLATGLSETVINCIAHYQQLEKCLHKRCITQASGFLTAGSVYPQPALHYAAVTVNRVPCTQTWQPNVNSAMSPDSAAAPRSLSRGHGSSLFAWPWAELTEDGVGGSDWEFVISFFVFCGDIYIFLIIVNLVNKIWDLYI